jgi:hypothetical protein
MANNDLDTKYRTRKTQKFLRIYFIKWHNSVGKALDFDAISEIEHRLGISKIFNFCYDFSNMHMPMRSDS